MSKIAILADSGCQIDSDYTSQGVFIVPLQITLNQTNYLDGIDITEKEVFTKMLQEDCHVSTSQPSTGSLIEVLNTIKKEGYDQVIAISLASGLSSTVYGMKLAADMVKIPIYLVDSKTTATNQRYLIKVAMTLVHEGKSVDTITNVLNTLIEDSATLIMVTDLEHLTKGGRITPAVAMLGNMLKIIPIMKLNYELGGKIDSFGKVRTVKKANIKIIEYFKEKNIDDKNYIISLKHVLCDNVASKMKEHLETELNGSKVSYGLLPAVVGAHMGIGGIGYQYIKKYRDIEI